jgi:hypothetical protein
MTKVEGSDQFGLLRFHSVRCILGSWTLGEFQHTPWCSCSCVATTPVAQVLPVNRPCKAFEISIQSPPPRNFPALQDNKSNWEITTPQGKFPCRSTETLAARNSSSEFQLGIASHASFNPAWSQQVCPLAGDPQYPAGAGDEASMLLHLFKPQIQ